MMAFLFEASLKRKIVKRKINLQMTFILLIRRQNSPDERTEVINLPRQASCRLITFVHKRILLLNKINDHKKKIKQNKILIKVIFLFL